MAIIKMSNGISKREQYNIMKGAGNAKAADLTGIKLHIKGYLIFERENATGEVTKACGFIYESSNGNGIAVTNSRSLIEDIDTITDLVDNDADWNLEIVAGTSRAGRRFLRGNWAE